MGEKCFAKNWSVQSPNEALLNILVLHMGPDHKAKVRAEPNFKCRSDPRASTLHHMDREAHSGRREWSTARMHNERSEVEVG